MGKVPLSLEVTENLRARGERGPESRGEPGPEA
jgi:hypothetical protein